MHTEFDSFAQISSSELIHLNEQIQQLLQMLSQNGILYELKSFSVRNAAYRVMVLLQCCLFSVTCVQVINFPFILSVLPH